MRTTATLARSFRGVLAEGNFLDLSPFGELGFFDEAPLYSRYSQLDFLKDRPAAEIDRIVFNFALDYLDFLLRDCRPRGSFLAALTILKPSRKDPIVPSIFVCHGQVEERVSGRLPLDEPNSRSARLIQKLLGDSQDSADYEILQDTRTISPEVRVFVGPRSPANLLMVTIGELKAEFSAIQELRG